MKGLSTEVLYNHIVLFSQYSVLHGDWEEVFFFNEIFLQQQGMGTVANADTRVYLIK